MAATSVDFLLRRTGWLLFDRQRAEYLCDWTISFMGEQLGWGDSKLEIEQRHVKEQLIEYQVH